MALHAVTSSTARVAFPQSSAGASLVRACTPADMSAVAAMFHRVFRGGTPVAPGALEPYLRTLFFQHPWQDLPSASRVYVAANGEVEGFIGVLPLRMTLNERPVRAALASSLMVRDPQANPIAGARLMRAFLSGPQELSFSETSNVLAQKMWEKAGGSGVPAYSMEWFRILKPAGFALALLEGSTPAAKALRPIGWAADRLINAAHLKSFDVPPPLLRADGEAEPEAFAAAVAELSADYELRPRWEPASLRYILQHAANKRRHGRMIRRIVHDRAGNAIGCYLCYARTGGIAYVLQLLARPQCTDIVIDCLLNDALELGCVGVRGRSDPKIQDGLLRRGALFLHRSSLTVHSRDPKLLSAVRRGEALLTGLAGESWTRLIGDTFD